MANRTPEQIRASIEANRADLGLAVERLRREAEVAMDWRRQIAARQQQLIIAAAVAGFVLGGGIAGITGIFRR